MLGVLIGIRHGSYRRTSERANVCQQQLFLFAQGSGRWKLLRARIALGPCIGALWAARNGWARRWCDLCDRGRSNIH